MQGFFIFLSIRRLVQTLFEKDKRKTIIYAHAVLPDGLAAILLKRKYKLKVICTAHRSDIYSYPFRTRLTYLLTKYVLRNVHLVVAVNEKLKEIIYDIAEETYSVEVITNGVNPQKISCVSDKNSYPVNSLKVLNILFVGTVSYEKGIRELLLAFKLLKNHYEGIKLIIVGEIMIRQWVRTFIEEYDLNEYIELTGSIQHEDLKYYYSRASIFVLPSYNEGSPTVMFEAMSSRLPLIISDVGGVSEIINNGINGLLVQPRSADDLYKKLKLLVENKKLRDELSERAYNDVMTKYTWQHNAKRMISLYNGLVNLCAG